ncbi:hypothetical protein JOE31_000410 [Arthrobacter sp. PvP023]|uniref:hypothetical protein n=1 Tax=Micrococcaceae TaxID=1268 RepID=UPI001B5B223D|nr:hypothetical protein [Arthrobacter sp. PvP023]MBP1134178.1 hypothetical protein [Arthrobacter sp. PvP023]
MTTGPAATMTEPARISDGSGPAGYPPKHCGVAMEWSTPAAQTMSAYSYSYDAGEALADLPEVWRCRCGFQLDSWVNAAPAASLLADIRRS